jgi:hypothetical protein
MLFDNIGLSAENAMILLSFSLAVGQLCQYKSGFSLRQRGTLQS